MNMLFMIIILLMISGCTHSENTLKSTETDYSTATISGYVTAVHEGEFFIVDMPSEYEKNDNFPKAYWVYYEKELEVGDYVYVWSSGVEFLTDPIRTEAIKIVIEEDEKQETDLTTKEVIQRVLIETKNVTGEEYYQPMVKQIYYEQNTDNWIVNIRNYNASENADLKIQIEDMN